MNSIGWRAEKPRTHKKQVTKVNITAPKLRAEANTDVSQYYRSAFAMEDFLFSATIIERRRSLPDRPVLVVAVGPDLVLSARVHSVGGQGLVKRIVEAWLPPLALPSLASGAHL